MNGGRREARASARNQTTLLPFPVCKEDEGTCRPGFWRHDARLHRAKLRLRKMNCLDPKAVQGVKSSSSFHPLEPRPNQTPTTVLKRMLLTIQS